MNKGTMNDNIKIYKQNVTEYKCIVDEFIYININKINSCCKINKYIFYNYDIKYLYIYYI